MCNQTSYTNQLNDPDVSLHLPKWITHENIQIIMKQIIQKLKLYLFY
jgi:hypothetical protein